MAFHLCPTEMQMFVKKIPSGVWVTGYLSGDSIYWIDPDRSIIDNFDSSELSRAHTGRIYMVVNEPSPSFEGRGEGTNPLLEWGERCLSPRARRRRVTLFGSIKNVFFGFIGFVRVGDKKELPKAHCGFRVQKDAEGQWYFGRPKGSAIWWDKCELGDLLHLGLSGDDLKGVVVNAVYWARVAPELLHAT
jgi:hypothetical protein